MLQGRKMMVLAGVLAVSAGMSSTVYGADSTFEMRKKAVSLLGILTTGNYNANVTRAEFASMLVKASEYRQTAKSASNVSVYADVPVENEYATAIRTASDNEWMTGFLGGKFKPEEPVTMRDAAKAVLGLLGYTNSDFTGNLNESRMAKFSSLSLDTNIYRDQDEVITKEDCINLFYNLMKAEKKGGGKYGSQVFDLSFNSDGEVNTSSILDNSLKGPKLVENNLKKIVPFSLEKATMFLNGEASDAETINYSATVIYYHEETKTIFGYSDSGENKGATEGRIKAIYYDSTDPFTPVSVVLDTYNQEESEDGDEFQLTSSELQYLFSVYGDFGVGDDIALVWEKSGREESATYTAIDVIGD